MDTPDSLKKQPDLDPSHELPSPHDMELKAPYDMELPKPHDMQLKPHLTHRHSFLHWLPALLGLIIGISVGIFFTKDAEEYRKQINNYYSKPNKESVSPTSSSTNPEGKFCGGIAANLPEYQCPNGYYCQLDGDYPDASGRCVKNEYSN